MQTSLEREFMTLDIDAGDPARRLVVEHGSLDDYAALARHHYRAGPPATCAGVLRMVDPHDGLGGGPVAVLVASMPTLNATWRELAWPGRYRTGDKRADAKRINAELRTLSRVVVDPRWRGLGVAGRLVRAYLADPLTVATEAVAAMGTVCPFFASAGMRAYRLPPSRRDARLADALAGVGAEPWELLDDERAGRLAGLTLIERELRLWARASKATHRFAEKPVHELVKLAALSTDGMVAYAAVVGN